MALNPWSMFQEVEQDALAEDMALYMAMYTPEHWLPKPE